MASFYFGAVDHHLGHFLHRMTSMGLRRVPPLDPSPLPWESLDGTLAPSDVKQREGAAKLWHKDGWTALAFWDRSVDTRGNSNSAFFFDAHLDFDAAVETAQRIFPVIWQRFTFPITPAE